MGLAEVSRFPSDYLTVAELVESWKVSERTLRRRLAAGVPGALQDSTGQWLLSARWADSEFQRKAKSPDAMSGTDTDVRPPLEPEATTNWVQELLDREHRATKAEAALEIVSARLEELKGELKDARADLDYERSLVHRLKDQLRGQVDQQPKTSS